MQIQYVENFPPERNKLYFQCKSNKKDVKFDKNTTQP